MLEIAIWILSALLVVGVGLLALWFLLCLAFYLIDRVDDAVESIKKTNDYHH